MKSVGTRRFLLTGSLRTRFVSAVCHSPKVHRPTLSENVIMFFPPASWRSFPAGHGLASLSDGSAIQYAVSAMTAAIARHQVRLTLSEGSTAEWCVYLYPRIWFMLMPGQPGENKRPASVPKTVTCHALHSPKASLIVELRDGGNQVIASARFSFTTGPWPLSVPARPHGWPVRPCAFWCNAKEQSSPCSSPVRAQTGWCVGL